MSNSRIARDTALLTGGQLAGIVLTILPTILITRILGPDSRGVYAWVLTVAQFGIQLATLAPLPAVRTLAERGDPRLPATLVALALGGTLLTAPLLAYAWFEGAIGSLARPQLLAAWLAVPLTAASLSLVPLIQIRGRADQILTVQIGPRAVQFALAVGLAWSGRLDLAVAVWIFTTVAAVELGLILACLAGDIRDLRPSLALMREAASLLGAGWLAAISLFVLPRIGLVVLGATGALAVTGQYSVALTLQEVSTVAPAALGGVLVTHVLRHGAPGWRKGLRSLAPVLLPMAAAFAVAALLAPTIVTFIFGPAFAPAGDLFRILLVSVLLATVYQLCQPLLYRHGRGLAIPAFAGVGVATGVALLAVPPLGVTGAVLSNLLGFATLASLALVLLRRPGPTPTSA
jgi:O-antigen/teichoic acid export membrane protein